MLRKMIYPRKMIMCYVAKKQMFQIRAIIYFLLAAKRNRDGIIPKNTNAETRNNGTNPGEIKKYQGGFL